MAHEISALVGSDGITSAVERGWPGALRLACEAGWWVVPLEAELVERITGSALVVPDLEDASEAAQLGGVVGPIVNALGALALDEPVALVFTQYFGGTGEQAAVLARDGVGTMEVVVGPNAIDSVLETLGVQPLVGKDAFDTVGLGKWRSMDALVAAARAVEQADEADDRARLTPRDTEEGFGVLALRRAPRARSLSAVFDGPFGVVLAMAEQGGFAGHMKSWWQLPFEIAGCYGLGGGVAQYLVFGPRPLWDPNFPVIAGVVASAVLLTLAVRARAALPLLVVVAALVPVALVFVVRWDVAWHLAFDAPGSVLALAWSMHRRAHPQLLPSGVGSR